MHGLGCRIDALKLHEAVLHDWAIQDPVVWQHTFSLVMHLRTHTGCVLPLGGVAVHMSFWCTAGCATMVSEHCNLCGTVYVCAETGHLSCCEFVCACMEGVCPHQSSCSLLCCRKIEQLMLCWGCCSSTVVALMHSIGINVVAQCNVTMAAAATTC